MRDFSRDSPALAGEGWGGGASTSDDAEAAYFTASNSTSNIKVAFGGIAPPAPRAP
jgi:hypothetical protein